MAIRAGRNVELFIDGRKIGGAREVETAAPSIDDISAEMPSELEFKVSHMLTPDALMKFTEAMRNRGQGVTLSFSWGFIRETILTYARRDAAALEECQRDARELLAELDRLKR